jgi:hypothetical protein
MSGEMRPHLQSANREAIAWGVPRRGSPYGYVAPDIAGDLHHSMTWAWRILEYVPKNGKYKNWPIQELASAPLLLRPSHSERGAAADPRRRLHS